VWKHEQWVSAKNICLNAISANYDHGAHASGSLEEMSSALSASHQAVTLHSRQLIAIFDAKILPLSQTDREELQRAKRIVEDDDFTRGASEIIRRAEWKASDEQKDELRGQLRKLCERYHRPADQHLAHLESFLRSPYAEVSPPPLPGTRNELQQTTPAPIPSGTPSAAPREFATLTIPVEVSVRYGKLTLQRGTRLKITSRTATTVYGEYLGRTVSVPISSTDLAK
jgi:hypothetical protein